MHLVSCIKSSQKLWAPSHPICINHPIVNVFCQCLVNTAQDLRQETDSCYQFCHKLAELWFSSVRWASHHYPSAVSKDNGRYEMRYLTRYVKRQKAINCVEPSSWGVKLEAHISYRRLLNNQKLNRASTAQCWGRYTLHGLITASDLCVISSKKGSCPKKKNTFLHNCPS